MKKKLIALVISSIFFLNITGCGTEQIEITTEEITIYAGEKIDLTNKIKYANESLEDYKVEIISGDFSTKDEGTYNITIEATAQNAEKATKDIKVIIKEFEENEEVCDFANELIAEKELDISNCTVSTNASPFIIIGGINITRRPEDNIKISLQTDLYASNPILWNDINNPEKLPILSKKNYFKRISVEIKKDNQPTPSTEHYYEAKTIEITSDAGTYKMSDKDSLVMPDWDRTSNGIYYYEKTHNFTSMLGYNLRNLDEFNKVIKGNNVAIEITLYNGLNEDKGETKFKIDLTEEEKNKFLELVEFENNFIYEYSNDIK